MLYLFPNVLEESQNHETYLPASLATYVHEIDGIIAESEKSARAFLKRFSFSRGRTFREIPIKLLNEHTTRSELKELLQPLLQKQIWGLISDCGLPCLADPGSALVALAHKNALAVKTFSGPSSIVMALMLSGLCTQRFTFHGYLPREQPALIQKLKSMELDAMRHDTTQIFIEAPYRNQKLLEVLVETLPAEMILSVACDITLETELVHSFSITQWKKRDLSLYQKRPTVFVLGKSILS